MTKVTDSDIDVEGGCAADILDNSAELTVKRAKEIAEIEMILAKGRVDALMLLMGAEEQYMSKLAGSVEMLNAADNTLSDEIIKMRLKMALIHKLPELLKTTNKSVNELLPSLMELLK